jgi:hypothetical protein
MCSRSTGGGFGSDSCGTHSTYVLQSAQPGYKIGTIDLQATAARWC